MIKWALAALAALALTASAWAPAVAQDRWRGNYFPNSVLTDQDGRQVRFYDDLLRNKIVVVNFIYTECPDVCPLDTAQLRRVQQILGDRVGRDFFMYSISIDPRGDTPETLRHYMQMYDIGPGWRFFTGARRDVEELQRRLGLAVGDPNNLREHDTSLIIGNERTGQWIKRSPFDNPQVLANLLTETLADRYTSRSANTRPDYAAAQRLENRSRGEYLYRTRCASCHTLGGGDGIGPDLEGVAGSRPRPWLQRWLREPDRMIAERDPTALALMARYRNLPMPNLSLSAADADAVISFLEQSDRAAAQAALHANHHRHE